MQTNQFGQLGSQYPLANPPAPVKTNPAMAQANVTAPPDPSTPDPTPIGSWRGDPNDPNAKNPYAPPPSIVPNTVQTPAPQPQQTFMQPQPQQLGAAPFAQFQPQQQNMLAMIQNQGPQGLQNYMQALNMVGSANNGQMNAPGQQGQMAQSGFQGFQTNGTNQPQQQMYGGVNGGGYQGGGYGMQQNQSYLNANQQGYNGSTQGQYGQMQAPTAQQFSNNPVYSTQLANTPQFQNNGFGAGSNGGLNQADMTSHWQVNPNVAYSDKNLKTEIEPAQMELQEFLNALGAYKYEYKDPRHGEGEHVSVMAQELEASKLGKEAVIQTPEGKMVNYGGRLPAIQLAATAMLNNKLNQLENKINKMIKGKRNAK